MNFLRWAVASKKWILYCSWLKDLNKDQSVKEGCGWHHCTCRIQTNQQDLLKYPKFLTQTTLPPPCDARNSKKSLRLWTSMTGRSLRKFKAMIPYLKAAALVIWFQGAGLDPWNCWVQIQETVVTFIYILYTFIIYLSWFENTFVISVQSVMSSQFLHDSDGVHGLRCPGHREDQGAATRRIWKANRFFSRSSVVINHKKSQMTCQASQ